MSGPMAGEALERLSGSLPKPRQAGLRQIRDPEAGWLDEALVLWFPAPRSATGEDCAEIHCHGGRAVIAAIERALEMGCGLRCAEPGEFTRRAFVNGRMDLLEAEALSDMLSAETELQRAVLAHSAGGRASTELARWREAVLAASAAVEQELDFSDEDEEGVPPASQWRGQATQVAREMDAWLSVPSADRLREGLRIVLGGKFDHLLAGDLVMAERRLPADLQILEILHRQRPSDDQSAGRSSIQIPMAIIARFSVSETKPSGTLLPPPTHAHLISRFWI